MSDHPKQWHLTRKFKQATYIEIATITSPETFTLLDHKHPGTCRTIRIEAIMRKFDNRFSVACKLIAMAMVQKEAEIQVSQLDPQPGYG